jgi:hypothetical protein
MSERVGHALAYGGSVVMRRVATDGEKAGEGRGEACCWFGKPEMNKSNLDQTGSKTPKATKAKGKATIGWGRRASRVKRMAWLLLKSMMRTKNRKKKKNKNKNKKSA